MLRTKCYIVTCTKNNFTYLGTKGGDDPGEAPDCPIPSASPLELLKVASFELT